MSTMRRSAPADPSELPAPLDLSGGPHEDRPMQMRRAKKMRGQRDQKRRSTLSQVKRLILQRSASARPVVPGDERTFSFIPPEAKLEVVAWPEL